MANTQKDYRETLAMLRVNLPCAYPVSVRRMRKMPEDIEGDATFSRKGKWRFAIRISAKLTWSAAIDTLLHEWAHALSWTASHQKFKDHGPEWGLAMSRCYQAVIGEE